MSFENYSHQVAGHNSNKNKKDKGLLVKGNLIYKKKDEKEFKFYEEKILKIEKFFNFIPKYFGVSKIENEGFFLKILLKIKNI